LQRVGPVNLTATVLNGEFAGTWQQSPLPGFKRGTNSVRAGDPGKSLSERIARCKYNCEWISGLAMDSLPGVNRRNVLLMVALLICLGADEEETTTYRSKDGNTIWTVPIGWESYTDSDHPEFQIAVSNYKIHAFARVVSEPKEDITQPLEKWAQARMDSWKPVFSDVELSDPEPIEFNGYKGVAYFLHGTYNHFRYAYIAVCFESPSGFNDLRIWCGQSLFKKNKEEMMGLIKGVHEVERVRLPTSSSKPATNEE
jgi:hypothetical protein